MGLIISVVVILLLACSLLIYHVYSENKKNKTKMSFKESLDLVGLPVVTFYQGSNKFHFLLDSGASHSCISEDRLKEFEYTKHDIEGKIYGMEGNESNASIITMPLYYKNYEFTSEFLVFNLTQSFDNVKRDSGVTICGILGSDFFAKYKYVLDYKDNIAYTK